MRDGIIFGGDYPVPMIFYPNLFDSFKDLTYNLGNLIFEYNYLRRFRGWVIT
jgi:hypothetical protein